MKHKRVLTAVLCSLLTTHFFACQSIPEVTDTSDDKGFSSSNVGSHALIQGDDDRVEPYQNSHGAFAQRVTGMIARVYDRDALPTKVGIQGPYTVGTKREYKVISQTLMETENLCPNEKFATQPRVGFCSGILIEDDLFLTAAHCLKDKSELAPTPIAIVFDFAMSSNPWPSKIFEDDVYLVNEVVAAGATGTISRGNDYALLRLNRPVTGRTPYNMCSARSPKAVQRTRNPGYGFLPEHIWAAGHGAGLPLKLSMYGSMDMALNFDIVDGSWLGNDTFLSTLDAIGGNSGGPIFSYDDKLVGIMKGEYDLMADGYFEADKAHNCNRWKKVPEDYSTIGIEITRVRSKLCYSMNPKPSWCDCDHKEQEDTGQSPQTAPSDAVKGLEYCRKNAIDFDKFPECLPDAEARLPSCDCLPSFVECMQQEYVNQMVDGFIDQYMDLHDLTVIPTDMYNVSNYQVPLPSWCSQCDVDFSDGLISYERWLMNGSPSNESWYLLYNSYLDCKSGEENDCNPPTVGCYYNDHGPINGSDSNHPPFDLGNSTGGLYLDFQFWNWGWNWGSFGEGNTTGSSTTGSGTIPNDPGSCVYNGQTYSFGSSCCNSINQMYTCAGGGSSNNGANAPYMYWSGMCWDDTAGHPSC